MRYHIKLIVGPSVGNAHCFNCVLKGPDVEPVRHLTCWSLMGQLNLYKTNQPTNPSETHLVPSIRPWQTLIPREVPRLLKKVPSFLFRLHKSWPTKWLATTAIPVLDFA